ncbi:MAG: thiamine/thiamine pyrophosphate ABC transporter permease ThiP [Brucellaceae bacterium]|nr:thiamine/thiamine pyrophosphate ABC transporter permease ThiP [Brucellaceae bacterium]
MTRTTPHRARAAWPGIAALAAVAVLLAGSFTGLGLAAASAPGSDVAGLLGDPFLWSTVRFTLLQAGLSTALSVLPAVPLALALSRNPAFPLRSAIVALLAVPLAIPALVAALAILAVLGRQGLVSDLMVLSGLDRWSGAYGLSGILAAHVFFNWPLATRMLMQALDTIPGDQWRLAAQLGFDRRTAFRHIEWPVMRQALPGIASLVLMLCITSFTVVLTLGGGPRSTTLEVAIYQALRFEFDQGRAALLTVIQLALTGAIVAALWRSGGAFVPDAGLAVARRARRHLPATPLGRLLDTLAIAAGATVVAVPLATMTVAGLRADLARLATEPAVVDATLTSLALGTASALLATMFAYALVATRSAVSRRAALFDQGASLVLLVPPIVIGAGWFVLLNRFIDVFSAAPFMVVAVNAAMALPFALRALRPAFDANAARHDRLALSLGIGGMTRLRLVDWPNLKRAFATAFVFAAALSLGDLGTIALFGSDALQTLPYLLYGRLGSYRTADAAGLALFLGLLCLALMLAGEALRNRSVPGEPR